MDTSSQSKKRKYSQVSGKNDGSVESLKAEIARLNEESKSKDSIIVKQALKINKLKSNQSNDDNDDVDEDMEAEMERLKENEAKLQAELGETQAKMEEEHNRHEAEIAALNSAALTRDREIRELEEQISVLKDVKVDFVTKNDTLEEERAAFQLKINDLKERVDHLTQKNAEGEAQAKEDCQKIQDRDKEIANLNKQLSSANKGKYDLKKLKNDKIELEVENGKLKSQVKELTQKYATSKAEAGKARKEVQDLNKQLASVNTAKNELLAKNVANIAELANKEKTLGANIAELTKKNSESEAKIIKMKSHVGDLTKKNSELEKNQKDVQKAATDNEMKIQEMKDEQKIQAEYERKIKQNSETMTAMAADQLLTVSANDGYKKKIKELEDQLQKANNEHKQKEDKTNATISDLKKTISDKKIPCQQEKNYYHLRPIILKMKEILLLKMHG